MAEEKSKNGVQKAVSSYAAEKRAELDEHPALEDLAAYHHRELTGPAAERVREHLTFCADCARLVLDLGRFADLEAPSAAHRLPDAQVATDKAALMSKLHVSAEPARLLPFGPRSTEARPTEEPAAAAPVDEIDSATGSATPSPEPMPPRVGARTIPVWYHAALAASLISAVGLGLWGMAQRRPPSQEAAGGINLQIQSLLPSAATDRGGVPNENRVFVPTSDLVLMLELLVVDRHTEYRVEILDAEGNVRWQDDGFERLPEGNFSLLFPRQLRHAGTFRLRLYGLAAAEPELMAEYLLLLEDG